VLGSRKPNPRLELYAERRCGVRCPPARLVHPRWQIIVNHCGLEALLIQVRSECVTLCIGELTCVCAYPPKFVLKSQDSLFHGDNHRSSAERKPRPKSGALRSIFELVRPLLRLFSSASTCILSVMSRPYAFPVGPTRRAESSTSLWRCRDQ